MRQSKPRLVCCHEYCMRYAEPGSVECREHREDAIRHVLYDTSRQIHRDDTKPVRDHRLLIK